MGSAVRCTGRRWAPTHPHPPARCFGVGGGGAAGAFLAASDHSGSSINLSRSLGDRSFQPYVSATPDYVAYDLQYGHAHGPHGAAVVVSRRTLRTPDNARWAGRQPRRCSPGDRMRWAVGPHDRRRRGRGCSHGNARAPASRRWMGADADGHAAPSVPTAARAAGHHSRRTRNECACRRGHAVRETT